jgi:hypothetical protein
VSRNEKLILAALVVVAVAGVCWQASAQGTEMPVLGAVEGVRWQPGYPVGHEHLALPADIGTVLWGPHPLYCGSNRPGQYRDALIDQGWAWISDPPSEATI